MNILHAHNRYQYLSRKELISLAKTEVLAFAYLCRNTPVVIRTAWHKFTSGEGFYVSPISGEALEIMISANVSGAIYLLEQFEKFPQSRGTDMVRLFYLPFSHAFREVSDVGIKARIQRALKIINSKITTNYSEVLNPDWSDSYTFETEETEYIKVKSVENVPAMEFDTTEYDEDEDFGLAGDGLHEEKEFTYAEMSKDYTISPMDLGKIKGMVKSLIRNEIELETVLQIMDELDTAEEQFAFFFLIKPFISFSKSIYQNYMVETNSQPMTLKRFSQEYGELIMESLLMDNSPSWRETTTQDIDKFCEQTLREMAIAYCSYDEDREKRSVTDSYAFLYGYLKSAINGASPTYWNDFGWDNYRINISSDGQRAFKYVLRNKGSLTDANKAFWRTYHNTILSYSQKGLKLRSSEIEWRRAYYKAQAKEFPPSQIKKLVSLAKKLQSSDPWVQKIALLPA